ncbi:MAG: hypothetical protein AB2L11_00585 [Syntrophobacteraceae bacterium]
MPDQIEVFVNGISVKLYRGMRVKHALISHDYALYRKVEAGEMVIEDENGFRIGLEGALHNNSKIFTKRKTS